MLQPHTAPVETAEKADIGKTIVEHVSNSPHDHPLIHLPTVLGIDLSVTKHVLMLWIVATLLFFTVTLVVRRYVRQDRLVPSGFMNALEAVVEFIREGGGVKLRETFDAEGTYTPEQQRQGWQAILDRFARHVEGRG